LRGEHQMEDAIKNYEDVDSWKTVIFLYNAAMKEVGTKLEILNDEFQHVHKYNHAVLLLRKLQASYLRSDGKDHLPLQNHP
jgi:ppGpp synthetase/RelA/SpoT-type nucleotidyltranferase